MGKNNRAKQKHRKAMIKMALGGMKDQVRRAGKKQHAAQRKKGRK